ncbi:hypothetical protein ACFQ1S_36535, partial [Kibdelosporangium lantanae]
RPNRASRTIPGMVSNAVPLVLDVRPGMSVASLFEQVSAEVRRATGHQRYRAEDIHRDLRLVGDRKRLWGPEINLLLYGEDPSFAGSVGKVRGFAVGPEEDLTLVVDGQVVRTATGDDTGVLKPVDWDVRDLRGQSAQVRVTDQATGAWGHVMVDQLLLSD